MTAQDRIERLEEEYEAFALIPDHRWGREQSDEFNRVCAALHEAYELAGTDDDERIVF